VALQRVGQEIGKNLSVLRAHVDSGMDEPTFLLPELKQKFRRVCPIWKKLAYRPCGFRRLGGEDGRTSLPFRMLFFPTVFLIDLGLAFVNGYTFV
jgi:hypothetical protein